MCFISLTRRHEAGLCRLFAGCQRRLLLHSELRTGLQTAVRTTDSNPSGRLAHHSLTRPTSQLSMQFGSYNILDDNHASSGEPECARAGASTVFAAPHHANA